MLLTFSYFCNFSSHLLCKLSTGNMCFPQKSSRCFAHTGSVSVSWIFAPSYNSSNDTKEEAKTTCRISSKTGLQEVILILPILIVACLLITSCESGVNLVTSCNQTFYFYFKSLYIRRITTSLLTLHLTYSYHLNSSLFLKSVSCIRNLVLQRPGSPTSLSSLHKITPPLTMGNVEARGHSTLTLALRTVWTDASFPNPQKWKP